MGNHCFIICSTYQPPAKHVFGHALGFQTTGRNGFEKYIVQNIILTWILIENTNIYEHNFTHIFRRLFLAFKSMCLKTNKIEFSNIYEYLTITSRHMVG